MSQHARARSRPPRKPRATRRTRRAVLAAVLGLATFTVGWVYVAQDPDEAAGPRPQARVDARPQAEDRAARDARRAAQQAERQAAQQAAQQAAAPQGLAGVSERTRARIPAESRQLVLVTGNGGGWPAGPPAGRHPAAAGGARGRGGRGTPRPPAAAPGPRPPAPRGGGRDRLGAGPSPPPNR
ncbi:hypothetical protein ACFV4S_35435, partial [Streptomyces sp. NPDC059742]